MEAELRQKDAMFRVVFEHHYQFTGVLDPEGHLLVANNTALRFAGVTEEDVVGNYFWETSWWRHSIDEQNRLREGIEKASAGEFVHFETSHINAHDEIRQIDFTLNPVLNGAGKVIYMVPEGRDITDERRAQQAIKESEEKYRNVVEVTYDAIAIAVEGKLKFFNRRVVEVTGYDADELTDMPFINLVYPEDRNMVADRYRGRLAGEEVEREYSFRYVKKDGSVGWAEINTALIEWEGKTAALVSLRDITDRKKAEDALRDSEERYRKLAESTVDIIATVDMDLVLTYVNNSVKRTLGYDPQEVVGLPLSNVVTPASYANLVAIFKDDLDKVLPPGSISETREIEFIKKDGSTLWTEGKLRWLRDADQNPIGVIGVIRDNTERRLAAEALRKSEEKYRAVVENAMEGIIVLQDAYIKFVNQYMPALLGFSHDFMLSHPFIDYIHADDREAVIERYRRRLAGEDYCRTAYNPSHDVEWLFRLGGDTGCLYRLGRRARYT